LPEEARVTDSNYTAIKLVVDRSGSVKSFLSDAQGAVDAFIDSQRKVTDRRITVAAAQFDTEYEELYPSTPVAEAKPIVIVPRGGTALRDAFGRGISEFGVELAALPEDQRPSTVVFALMTDGEENSSQEWTDKALTALIRQQEEVYGWDIVFLAANQDAVANGMKMGIRADAALTYATTEDGTRGLAESFNSYVAVASAAPPGVRGSFTDEDRERSSR
jgi:hypothetical protein